jgi:hypothetical protein
MVELTDSLVTVSKYIETMLSSNAVALNLEDVFYGDQQRIPRTPAACVESGEKRRTLKGAPRMTLVDITTYIIVYHYKLKSVQEIREDNDLLAEAIETLVHSDCKLGGYVIDSMVTSVESGYQMKGNSLFRASRLTIEARSQVLLPLPV